MSRWYMVDKIGRATLCTDELDARREAANAELMWPRNGPHRAVQLVEMGAAPAPVARQPLDYDQLKELLSSEDWRERPLSYLVRAVEAAHGIIHERN